MLDPFGSIHGYFHQKVMHLLVLLLTWVEQAPNFLLAHSLPFFHRNPRILVLLFTQVQAGQAPRRKLQEGLKTFNYPIDSSGIVDK